MNNNQTPSIQQQANKSATKLPIIAITQGDTNGIGYEVICKAFETNTMFEICIPVIYGHPSVAISHKKALGLPANFNIINDVKEAKEGCLNIVNCGEEELKVNFGNPSPEAGQAAYVSLKRAVNDTIAEKVDAVVTAPINKANIQSNDFQFTGHTEYLEANTEGEALMILANQLMRVALVTTHHAVADVTKHITQDTIQKKIELFYNALRQDFLLPAPRIAVLGLNPHNGDNGLMGSEEETIIKPAVKAINEKGIPCFGPYPADGFFGAAMYVNFDGILAMYHDQGLTPFKALSMDDGVNFTAGLSIVRTSPDHGTAYDIAGKNIASPQSMRNAIYAAIDIARNRKADIKAKQNPLPKLFNDRREDEAPRRQATEFQKAEDTKL